MPRSDCSRDATYSHDALSRDELLDLLDLEEHPGTALFDKADEIKPAEATVEEVMPSVSQGGALFCQQVRAQLNEVELEQSSLAPGATLAVQNLSPTDFDVVSMDGLARKKFEEEFVGVRPPEGDTELDLSDLEPDFEGLATVDEALDLNFEISEVDLDEQEIAHDFVSEVSGERRARQQAIAFLISIGELSGRNVDWMVEIILARRWSTAQIKVRELWHSGYSLRSIYQAFCLSELWRNSDAFDECPEEYMRGPAWMSTCQPRLSWWESMQIIVFHGEECDLDQVVEFIEAQRYMWRSSSRLRQRFGRFKDYLLRQRISAECRSPNGGWYRTLDPRDERSFDGGGNPEYTARWWDDEVPALGGSQHIERRVFLGDALGSLIFEPDDGLDWLED